MKDAVGSSVLFYVILIFLAIFIIFIAFLMQYATAYRASNYVVTMLERSEGQVSIGNKTDKAEDTTLYGALKARLYNGDLTVVCNQNKNGAVFKVTTSIKFNLPLLDVHIPIYIHNESKTLYKIKCIKTPYGDNKINFVSGD